MKSQFSDCGWGAQFLRWFVLAISYGSSHKLTCSSQVAKYLSG